MAGNHLRYVAMNGQGLDCLLPYSSLESRRGRTRSHGTMREISHEASADSKTSLLSIVGAEKAFLNYISVGDA